MTLTVSTSTPTRWIWHGRRPNTGTSVRRSRSPTSTTAPTFGAALTTKASEDGSARDSWCGSGPGEHEAELADLDPVAIGQRRRFHRFAVDVGAVEAADVDDREVAVFHAELGVAAADGHVVEVDGAAWMAACSCDGLIQHESGPGVGAALDDQQGRAAGQLGDSRYHAPGVGCR